MKTQNKQGSVVFALAFGISILTYLYLGQKPIEGKIMIFITLFFGGIFAGILKSQNK